MIDYQATWSGSVYLGYGCNNIPFWVAPPSTAVPDRQADETKRRDRGWLPQPRPRDSSCRRATPADEDDRRLQRRGGPGTTPPTAQTSTVLRDRTRPRRDTAWRSRPSQPAHRQLRRHRRSTAHRIVQDSEDDPGLRQAHCASSGRTAFQVLRFRADEQAYQAGAARPTKRHGRRPAPRQPFDPRRAARSRVQQLLLRGDEGTGALPVARERGIQLLRQRPASTTCRGWSNS